MSYQTTATIQGSPGDALDRLSLALQSRGYQVESTQADTVNLSSDVTRFTDPVLNSSEVTIKTFGQTIQLTANLSNIPRMYSKSNKVLVRVIALITLMFAFPIIGVFLLDFPNGFKLLAKAGDIISRNVGAMFAFMGVPIIVSVALIGAWYHLRCSYEPRGIQQLNEMVTLAATNESAV